MPEVSIINCDPEVRKNTAQVLLKLATTTTPQVSTSREDNSIPSYILDYAVRMMKTRTKEEKESLIREIQEVSDSSQLIHELFWVRLLIRFEKEGKINRLIKAICSIKNISQPIDTRLSGIVSNPYKFVTKLKEVL